VTFGAKPTQVLRWLCGHWPQTLTLVAYLLGLGLSLADRARYLALLGLLGFRPPDGEPFFDTRGVLAQIECWQKGIDVYAVNPCDPIGRLHNYSPVWLRLTFLPTDAGAVLGIGFALNALFLVGLFFLPTRGLRPLQGVLLTLAMTSWATAFALQRGNMDLLMFVLAEAACYLWLIGGVTRFLGYVAVLIGASLKFYPAVVLVVALRERPGVLFRLALAAVGAVVVFMFGFGGELARAVRNIPDFPESDQWGAMFLWYGLLSLRDGVAAPSTVAWATFAMGLEAIAVSLLLAQSRPFRTALAALRPAQSLVLVAGAALVCGCFFAGLSSGYRAVMLLLAMPALLSITQSRDIGTLRWVLLVACVGIPYVMWFPVLPDSVTLWMANQLVWWTIVTVLLAVLWRFALDSPSLRMLRAWAGR
jgi:hypothetical protein